MESTKATLRTRFLAQRRALSTDDVDQRSQAIANRFRREPSISERLNVSAENSSPIIHTFLPIQHQNEVNTWPIIHRLWHEYLHVQIAVSVTDTATRQLTHHPLTPGTALAVNRWGIPEPIVTDEAPISSGNLAIVLVPLLAFDRQGQRVGYGGGFYDRFLAECHPDCLKVGLSFFDPIERISDIELTDVPLDVCITASQPWHFRKLVCPR